ncbi:hypothetical protein H8S33_00015 [Ornithinibacillus sp. BX22]|uniref:Uncharacterized protein n=1 Tax=Ornithinibacillus hominis TaxID=2763055 RepID=A0A923RHL9_9BACI|nr:hypothetical protein [Ornithinibacillus hominis]MBC5635197.1 hypothetical protein [Ornithinibacillus hominis]
MSLQSVLAEWAKSLLNYGNKVTVLLADVNEERLVQTKEEFAGKGITDVEYQTVDITELKIIKLSEKDKSIGTINVIVYTAVLSPTMADLKRITQVSLVGTGIVFSLHD